ncbi:MAG: CbtA family protein, partial [Dermatophilaceae bacterium]
MTARAFLIRGLLAGLLAGLAAFVVAYTLGEPHVDQAIALEQAAAATPDADAAAPGTDDDPTASSAAEGATVSRPTQRTWGLLSGTLAVAIGLGGAVALGAAACIGRVGRLGVVGSTALVTTTGFVAVAFVPFLKYPANPPAVDDPETLGPRTALYFGFVLVSLVAAGVAVAAAAHLAPRTGGYAATVASTAGYLTVVVTAGLALPAGTVIGDFPGDTLWFFRRASLLALTTMWT